MHYHSVFWIPALNRRSVRIQITVKSALIVICLCIHRRKENYVQVFLARFYDSLLHDFPLQCLVNIGCCFFLSILRPKVIFCYEWKTTPWNLECLCSGRTGVRTYITNGRLTDNHVTTKLFWPDRLPSFLSPGAPLACLQCAGAPLQKQTLSPDINYD